MDMRLLVELLIALIVAVIGAGVPILTSAVRS